MTIGRPSWKAVDVGDTYSHDDINQFHFDHQSKLAYTGAAADGNTPADSQNADITTYWYASRFTMPAAKTALDRIEVKLVKGGTGVDLTLELYADSSGPTGAALASRTIPKEWVPTTAAGTVVSVPFPVTGLSALTNYWVVIRKAGTGGAYVKWRSLNSADASHPARRSTDGVTWSAALTEEMYVTPYYNDGTGDLVNVDEDSGVGQQWLQYTSGDLTKVAWRREDIRGIQTLTYANGQLVSTAQADGEA